MLETLKVLPSLARSLWRFAVTERTEWRDLMQRQHRCRNCGLARPGNVCLIHEEMAKTLTRDGPEAYWDLADLEDWSRRPADVRAIAEAFGVGPHNGLDHDQGRGRDRDPEEER